VFGKILIANRGESAVRVLRAAKELGIETVAVHSTADTQAMHVKLADESVCLGPPPARESYLNVPAIIAACEVTGAEAVHPGYGFLSEDAHFAEILAAHGIAFIGPKPEHIRIMADKIEAKRVAARLGLSCVPSSPEAITDLHDALDIAQEIGFPVLIKAATRRGRGMKVVWSRDELAAAVSASMYAAETGFGDGAIHIEKYLNGARRIEIQVLGDGVGNVIHLGERDCSLQRGQQLWVEGPSPVLDAGQRGEISELCAGAMREFGYSSAGTIKFLYESGRFYFVEMTTCIEAGHPVTEMITGLDLISEQIKIATGQSLSVSQSQVVLSGHAIECRIKAGYPAAFRLPPRKIEHYHAPGGPGVRIESAIYAGYSIPSAYDFLVGELIVHGRDRNEALMRLSRALDEFVVGGIETTIPLFQRLVNHDDMLTSQHKYQLGRAAHLSKRQSTVFPANKNTKELEEVAS
jgi:acetyl-CoA carboxylase biotin carboxylase subunit